MANENLNDITPGKLAAKLISAVSEDKVEEVKLILNHIATLSLEDKTVVLDITETLDMAVSNKNKEIVELLLMTAEEYSLSINGEVIFDTAKMCKAKDITLLLLDKIGQDLSQDYKGGLLADSAKIGNYDVVEKLLNMVENNITPSHKGQALKLAMGNKHPDIVKLLFNKFDDIPFEDKELALELAIKTQQNDIAESWLNQIGNDLSSNAKDLALFSAATKGSLNIVQLLIKLGITTNAKELTLKLAESYAHQEIVEFILDHLKSDSASNDESDAYGTDSNSCSDMVTEVDNQPSTSTFNSEINLELLGQSNLHTDF